MLGTPRHRLVDRPVAAAPAFRAPERRPLGAARGRAEHGPGDRPGLAPAAEPAAHRRSGRHHLLHRSRPGGLAGRRARPALGLDRWLRELAARDPDGADVARGVRGDRRPVVAQPPHSGRLRGPQLRRRRARPRHLAALRPDAVVRGPAGDPPARGPPARRLGDRAHDPGPAALGDPGLGATRRLGGRDRRRRRGRRPDALALDRPRRRPPRHRPAPVPRPRRGGRLARRPGLRRGGLAGPDLVAARRDLRHRSALRRPCAAGPVLLRPRAGRRRRAGRAGARALGAARRLRARSGQCGDDPAGDPDLDDLHRQPAQLRSPDDRPADPRHGARADQEPRRPLPAQHGVLRRTRLPRSPSSRPE